MTSDSTAGMTLEAIRSVPLFASFDDTTARELRELLQPRQAPAGTQLFRAGDDGDAMYLIKSGRVRLTLTDLSGKEITLAELANGDYFGEMAIIDGKQRSAAATVSEDAQLEVLSREDFLRFTKTTPAVMFEMLSATIARLRRTDEMLRQRVSRNVNEEENKRLILADRAADIIAEFGGSWMFLFVTALVMGVWMLLNWVMGSEAFDPYPFAFFVFALNILQSFQGPIIMMSQNRQSHKDRLQADLDYQVNLKNELSLNEVLRRLDILEGECLPRLFEEQTKVVGWSGLTSLAGNQTSSRVAVLAVPHTTTNQTSGMTLEAIRSVPLFASFDDATAGELRGLLRPRQTPAGTRLFRAGDDGDAMYLIKSGRVRLTVMDTDGKEITLAQLARGDYFGEMAIIDGKQRSAAATVSEDAQLEVLSREDFLRFTTTNPKVMFEVLSATIARLRRTDEMLQQRASRNVNEEEEKRLTFSGRAADIIAEFGGSWMFIIVSALFMGIWMLLNGFKDLAFDPYPYAFLLFILVILQSFQVPIILMSQNRQSDKDRLRADLDYQVNLKNETAVAEVLQRLDALESERLPHLFEEQNARITNDAEKA